MSFLLRDANNEIIIMTKTHFYKYEKLFALFCIEMILLNIIQNVTIYLNILLFTLE